MILNAPEDTIPEKKPVFGAPGTTDVDGVGDVGADVSVVAAQVP